MNKSENIEKEKIEVVCRRNILNSIITAIKKAHPYEEVAMDIYPLESS